MGGKDGSPGTTATLPQILAGNAILFAIIGLWLMGLVWLDGHRGEIPWPLSIALMLTGLPVSAVVVIGAVEAGRAMFARRPIP